MCGDMRRRREKPRSRNRDSRRDGRDETRDYKRRTTAAATHGRRTRSTSDENGCASDSTTFAARVGVPGSSGYDFESNVKVNEADVKFGVEGVEFDAEYISGSNRICSLRSRTIPREPAPPPRRVSTAALEKALCIAARSLLCQKRYVFIDKFSTNT